MIVTCSCGNLELEATGAAITSVVCYCDDCQEGARQIEALPNAYPVQDPDGGTGYVVYRKDRVKCTKGAELLKYHKIRANSATKRGIASCCNSAMFVSFDDSKHWVDLYRSRFKDSPPIQMRICTRFKPLVGNVGDDVPSYPGYPLTFVARLIITKVAMLLRL